MYILGLIEEFKSPNMEYDDSKGRFKDITVKKEGDTPPWSDIQDPENDIKPPWVPRKLPKPPVPYQDSGHLPMQRGERGFPREALSPELSPREGRLVGGERSEGYGWITKLRKLICLRKRRESQVGVEEAPQQQTVDSEDHKTRRITPSSYNAMEIHGFFGLVDDGPCSSGRMLIVHQPNWVRGQFLEIRDGDDIHAWHVSGKTGGVLHVLSTGRHRYYAPGQKVTTCTVCVPKEQWERLMQ